MTTSVAVMATSTPGIGRRVVASLWAAAVIPYLVLAIWVPLATPASPAATGPVRGDERLPVAANAVQRGLALAGLLCLRRGGEDPRGSGRATPVAAHPPFPVHPFKLGALGLSGWGWSQTRLFGNGYIFPPGINIKVAIAISLARMAALYAFLVWVVLRRERTSDALSP